jgi:hypothetical protein
MSLDCIVFQVITTEGINAFLVIFCILLNFILENNGSLLLNNNSGNSMQ